MRHSRKGVRYHSAVPHLTEEACHDLFRCRAKCMEDPLRPKHRFIKFLIFLELELPTSRST
jgi:hypothetical protein